MYQGLGILHNLSKLLGFSERSLVEKSALSRGTIRSIFKGEFQGTLKSLSTLAGALGCELTIIAHHKQSNSDYSSIATSLKIQQDGADSWKIHLMNLVDEFRRTQDMRLLLLSPATSLDKKNKALMAATVVQLCNEVECEPPAWANKLYYLEQPWFLSGMESLKASALLESPLAFRKNNIFVHDNFLRRA